MNTRTTVNYLKGLAIGIVVFSHFDYYFNNNNLGIFVNFVGLFFVLSGFGIYHSLEKQLSRSGSTLKALGVFYLKRAARIYPLYWLSYVLFMIYEPDVYPFFGLKPHTFFTFLGAPLYYSPGFFWFITSLFQCYMFAPIVYFMLKKLRPQRFFVLVVAMLPVAYLVTITLARNTVLSGNDSSPYITLYFYRDFLLTNVFMFSLGMMIVPLIRRFPNRFRSKTGIAASLMLFAAAAYLTNDPTGIAKKTPFFILGGFALCLFVIATKPKLPFKGFMELMGEYSFPIYLFHVFFYEALWDLNVIKPHSLKGALITFLLFPGFLVFAVFLQKFISGTKLAFTQAIADTYNRVRPAENGLLQARSRKSTS